LFDIAWSELALIGAVALIVIGPKDLPRVMRTMGQWTRRARLMAAEFQRNFDELMREAELEELRKEVENISPSGLKSQVEQMIDVKGMEEAMRITPEATAAPTPTPTPAPSSAETPETEA
jgi:sec-independent protein translocase protein TatB